MDCRHTERQKRKTSNDPGRDSSPYEKQRTVMHHYGSLFLAKKPRTYAGLKLRSFSLCEKSSELHQSRTELFLREHRFFRVVRADRMGKCLRAGEKEYLLEPFVRCQCIECAVNEFLICSAFPWMCPSFPPERLCRFPYAVVVLPEFLCCLADQETDLLLKLVVFDLERLHEPLHRSAKHSVKDEVIRFKVGECRSGEDGLCRDVQVDLLVGWL